MSYEFDITLMYSAGSVLVDLEGEEYPDDYMDRESELTTIVKKELRDLDDIGTWRNQFETAQEFSMPGMSPEPTVGTLVLDTETDDVVVDLTIDSARDCEGF